MLTPERIEEIRRAAETLRDAKGRATTIDEPWILANYDDDQIEVVTEKLTHLAFCNASLSGHAVAKFVAIARNTPLESYTLELLEEVERLRTARTASVQFSPAEARALYDLIDGLSGGNAGNVFAWDGTDDPADPATAACVKILRAVGKPLPENLEGWTGE